MPPSQSPLTPNRLLIRRWLVALLVWLAVVYGIFGRGPAAVERQRLAEIRTVACR